MGLSQGDLPSYYQISVSVGEARLRRFAGHWYHASGLRLEQRLPRMAPKNERLSRKWEKFLSAPPAG